MSFEVNNGVWPTLITAFTRDGDLDMAANRTIIRRALDMGASGVFAVCQSSEMFFLSMSEKITLAKVAIEETSGRASVAVSGHTAGTIDGQLAEISELARLKPDVYVLVTNRLDINNEGSDVLIGNLKRILDAFPDVAFGLYECPFPKLRLLSDEELKWCCDSGRIIFLKDVSCSAQIEAGRAVIARGSALKLFNANTETLLASLQSGYQGYNGVMGNMHIDIYRWLYDHPDHGLAKMVQEWLTEKSFIERPAYPMVAKYYLQLKGYPVSVYTRSKDMSLLDGTQERRAAELIDSEKQMRTMLGLPAQC